MPALVTQWSCIRSPQLVGARMGWPSSVGHPVSVCNQPPRQTQPPTLCGTGNEKRPNCCDALRLVRGTLNSWEWKSREWNSRHKTTGLENAGVEISAEEKSGESEAIIIADCIDW